MRNPLYILVLAFFLWGCAVSGRDFPTDPIKDIRPNISSKADIFAAFGEPVEEGLDTGYETWTYYQYTLGQTIGQKRLHIIFKKDGTVRSYSFSSN